MHSAHAVEAHEKAGVLSKQAFDESVIPDELRIPRMTAATWKYDTGAVGTLLHGTSLHGGEYAIELEVYADGVSLPVNRCEKGRAYTCVFSGK